MKIAIDIGPMSSGDSIRGIGTYVRELINALKKLEESKTQKLQFEVVDVSKIDLSKYDVVHFTRFNPFRISIPFEKPSKTKFILTIYDLIPLIYPKNYPLGVKGWLKWQINKLLIKNNVDAIVTISETSKKDIVRLIGVDPNRVFVTYLAPKEVFGKIKNSKYPNLPAKFALYVGDVNYNKNIPILIKSCKLARIPLVIAGKQAKEVEKMDLDHPELMHLKRVDWSGVIRLGFVPDTELVKIYNLALVYVQPSLYEGFGLPVVESFASGCPVVAAKTQALVEIGEAACLFADPKNTDDFADKIKEVLSNTTLRNQLINTGFELAKTYSWEKTARETLFVYEKA